MSERPSLTPVLLVNGIGSLGFSIVLPFLIFVVQDVGGNAVVYGALAATYPAFQLIAAPVLGRLSDRMGRRPVLLISQLGTALAWAMFTLALLLPVTALADVDTEHLGTFTLTVPLVMLFVSRMLDGLTGGNISVANAYVADVTPEEERSAAYGKMGVAASLGFVVGPAIAGLLGAHYMAPVLAALGLSIAATVVIVRWLPESLPCVLKRHPNRAQTAVAFGMEPRPCSLLDDEPGWRDAWRIPHVPWLLVLYFIAFAGFTLFQAAFPAHAADGLGWSVAETGALFTVLSAVLALVQSLLTGRLAKKLGNCALVVIGAGILGVGLFLFTVEHAAVVYAAAVLYGLGTGLMWPTLLAIIANVAGPEYQGTVQGLTGSAGGAASVLGLVLGGILYQAVGTIVFVCASAALFASAAMGLRVLTFSNTDRPANIN